MARSAVWLLAATLLLGMAPAGAGEVVVAPAAPGPVVVIGPHVDAKAAPPPQTGPLRPEPEVRYGCQRVWRCDTTVCEWRRGCRGVYGYYEGPYFTSEFARRQWESHGLGKPPAVKRKKRSSKKKTPAE